MSERLVAVLDGNIVANVVIVDSEWDNPDDSHVEYTDGYPAAIGWVYDGVGFISPQPFPSWVLEDYVWVAPEPQPDYPSWWDEDNLSWERHLG